MRLATLAVLGLCSLPVATAAQEHLCGCHGESADCDHDVAVTRFPAAAAPVYEFQYEGLFSGVIYNVMHHAGVDLQLTIGVGETSFEVVVAASDWLDARHIVFRPGERIQIVGARGDRGSSNTILAREIRTGDQTIVLRDNQGRRFWR